MLVVTWGIRALPDVYALCPWACGPRAVGRTYQAKSSCPCYNYYMCICLSKIDILLYCIFLVPQQKMINTVACVSSEVMQGCSSQQGEHQQYLISMIYIHVHTRRTCKL